MSRNLYHKGLIVLLSMGLWACGGKKDNVKTGSEVGAKKPETFALQRQQLATEISLPAELSGFRQVDLFAKVSSYVRTLAVDIGSEVREGQLLADLEAPEISARVAAAESRLKAQEALYTVSNSAYQRLLETSKTPGTVSQIELEQALAKKNADYSLLEAAKAGYNESKIMQSYLQLRAPFAGRVTARNVNIGAYVGQGGGLPLLTVQDNKKLRLSLAIPETYTGYLKTGDELSFKVVSIPGQVFKAKISRMSGALDLKLRAEKIELDVMNTEGKLLPGLVADVMLPVKSRENPFVVNRSAVITTSEGVFVIRVVNNKTERVKVATGLEAGDRVEIFSDQLEENDVLIARASEEMKEGTVVK